MNTGDRIKFLRQERGITQSQLSKELYITQSVLCQWEKGKRALKESDIISLSKLFDVSTDYLLLGKSASIHTDDNIQKLYNQITKSTTELVRCLEKLEKQQKFVK